MLDIISERFRQGFRTGKFPLEEPKLPPRFRGMVQFSGGCAAGCRACEQLCPFGACAVREGKMALDLGRCLFCADCPACPQGRITFGNDYRLAVRSRQDLLYSGGEYPLAQPLEPARLKLLGRSLKLRQVSAGGCNGCEADCNVLGTLVFDLGRFGIQFVASPRHADGILLTGPVSENMRSAVLDTYEAVPGPKVVIAVGACAVNGGPFVHSSETNQGLDTLLPVDLYIPGCPPQPYTILDGLLRLLGRREQRG
ncbi:MAG: hydrogenase [Desulfoarculaceae bacterium]|nr:hydrogenase [Desulfoarculaceae bacterium]